MSCLQGKKPDTHLIDSYVHIFFSGLFLRVLRKSLTRLGLGSCNNSSSFYEVSAYGLITRLDY